MSISNSTLRNLNFLSQLPANPRLCVDRHGDLNEARYLFTYHDEDAVVKRVKEIVAEVLTCQDPHTKMLIGEVAGGALSGIEDLAYACRDSKNTLELFSLRGRFYQFTHPDSTQEARTSVPLAAEDEDWEAVEEGVGPSYYLAPTGESLGFFGKICAIGLTLYQRLVPDSDPRQNITLLEFNKTLCKPGAEAGDVATDAYVALLRLKYGAKFHYDPTFRGSRDILSLSPEKLEKRLQYLLAESKKRPDDPIVIPFVLARGAMIEAGHITTAVIKNGILYYYDPKGEPASSHSLLNYPNKTLADQLEVIKKVFKAEFILENYVPQQRNIHDCGRFHMWFLQNFLVGPVVNGAGTPLTFSQIEKLRPTSADITEFGYKAGGEMKDYWDNGEHKKAFRMTFGMD